MAITADMQKGLSTLSSASDSRETLPRGPLPGGEGPRARSILVARLLKQLRCSLVVVVVVVVVLLPVSVRVFCFIYDIRNMVD